MFRSQSPINCTFSRLGVIGCVLVLLVGLSQPAAAKKKLSASAKAELNGELIDAVNFNDPHYATEVLGEGADPDALTPDGQPVLNLAAEKGYAEMVQLLLKKGADFTARDKKGLTALHEAVGQQHLVRLPGGFAAVAGALRRAGARDDLFTAIMEGREKAVLGFLKKGAKLTDRLDTASPLLISLLARREKITALLLKKGARVELAEAVAMGDLPAIAAQLAGGEDPKKPGPGGLSLHHIAALLNREEAIAPLVAGGLSPDTPAVEETRKGKGDGLTPVMMAVFYGHADMVRALLKAGAKPDLAMTPPGVSPLFLAVTRGDETLVRTLLEGGADPAVGIKSVGLTPLHVAVVMGNVPVTRLLLKTGVKTDTENMEGLTPLMLAVVLVQMPAAHYLMDMLRMMPGAFGPNPVKAGEPGFWLPKDYEEVMHALLGAGADPRHKGKMGVSALDMATRGGDLDLMDVLRSQVVKE